MFCCSRMVVSMLQGCCADVGNVLSNTAGCRQGQSQQSDPRSYSHKTANPDHTRLAATDPPSMLPLYSYSCSAHQRLGQPVGTLQVHLLGRYACINQQHHRHQHPPLEKVLLGEVQPAGARVFASCLGIPAFRVQSVSVLAGSTSQPPQTEASSRLPGMPPLPALSPNHSPIAWQVHQVPAVVDQKVVDGFGHACRA